MGGRDFEGALWKGGEGRVLGGAEQIVNMSFVSYKYMFFIVQSISSHCLFGNPLMFARCALNWLYFCPVPWSCTLDGLVSYVAHTMYSLVMNMVITTPLNNRIETEQK